VVTDPNGLDPKPTNGQYCSGSLENPNPNPGSCPNCDLGKSFSRMGQVDRLEQRFCSGSGSPPAGVAVPIGGVDWDGSGRAWYVPQGDKCVDHCICVHENFHIRQDLGMVPLPYGPITPGKLECGAYGAERSCLGGLLGRTIRGSIP